MRSTAFALLALAVACTGQGAVGTTPPTPPMTTPIGATTTTIGLVVDVQDCATPPVTFSALCEVFGLLQEWHVDRPLDPLELASTATRALEEAVVTETSAPPAILPGAVPDPAFTDFCTRLGEIVEETGGAVGPLVDLSVLTMVDATLGPFTYYVPPDQVPNARTDGIVGGIGVVLDARDVVGSRCARIAVGCPLEIVFVLDGNPGLAAGLEAGDHIVAVDDVPVEGQGFAATARQIAADETGRVRITVERDGRTLIFDIERATLVGPLVEVDLPVPGVAYLRIPNFAAEIPGLVREALEALAPFDPATFVVDLRDNPGGLVDVVVVVASEFIAEGPVFQATGPDDSRVYEASGEGLAHSARILVLVNRGTASAAEVLAGALRDRRGAVVIGTTTFGKDAVQIPFDLRNGGQLYVTVARWATPDGVTVGGGGLVPDVELDLGMDVSIEEVVDIALEAVS